MQIGVTALILASWNGHIQVVDRLLNAGAKPDTQSEVRKNLCYVHGTVA